MCCRNQDLREYSIMCFAKRKEEAKHKPDWLPSPVWSRGSSLCSMNAFPPRMLRYRHLCPMGSSESKKVCFISYKIERAHATKPGGGPVGTPPIGARLGSGCAEVDAPGICGEKND